MTGSWLMVNLHVWLVALVSKSSSFAYVLQKPETFYNHQIRIYFSSSVWKLKTNVTNRRRSWSTDRENTHICNAASWQEIRKSLYLKRVSDSSRVCLWFCKIQLLLLIQLIQRSDAKCPALAPPLPFVQMQQNRRKHWLKLRHSPGPKDLQLCFLNLYIYVFYSFFESSINKL